MTPAIQFCHVSKSFGHTEALKELSLSVNAGSIFGLLGPNGAGKTTAMRICSTLLSPDSGTVRLGGHDARESRRGIALMQQGKALDAMLNVRDNFRFYARLLGLPMNEAEPVIDSLSHTFGLDRFLNKSPFALSGGQFRRAQLARTFLGRPQYILLDEPTLGIDIQGKLTIWEAVREYVRRHNCTILLASNDMTEVEKTCDRVGFINRGRLLYEGQADNLADADNIRLDCKLSGPLDLNTLPETSDVAVETNGATGMTLTFCKYSSEVFLFLEHVSRIPGVESMHERRMSLIDLFDRYGGSEAS